MGISIIPDSDDENAFIEYLNGWKSSVEELYKKINCSFENAKNWKIKNVSGHPEISSKGASSMIKFFLVTDEHQLLRVTLEALLRRDIKPSGING